MTDERQRWNGTPARALILLAVAVAARALTFGNPILHVDEEFYLVVAQRMLQGALPYVDVWDRKPIGLFLVYLPAAAFGPFVGLWVLQALALASVVATALLLARLADRAGWRAGSLAGAALYILWLDLGDGQGGQAPVFYNLPVTGAVALIAAGLGAGDRRRRRLGVAAMALVGLALQIKYSVVFEGVAFGLWLLWGEWRAARRLGPLLGYGAALVAAALLPTALAVATYAALGHLPEFVFANFTSIRARKPDPAGEQIGNLVQLVEMLAPLVTLAVLGARGPQPAAEVPGLPRLLRLWLAAAIGGVLVFGSWFNHYALPVMAPAACCAAAFLWRGRWGRVAAVAALVLGFVAGQIVLISERTVRGSAADFARVVAALGPGPGTLFVYSSSTALYTRTGRTAPTRWLFPTHLNLARETGAIGVDQLAETRRILATRPEVIVLQALDPGERRDVRGLVRRALLHGRYRPVGRFEVGHRWTAVYRRIDRIRTSAPPRAAR